MEQTITNTNISQIAPSTVTLTSTTPIYLSSRQFSSGQGSTNFTGTSDGQVYAGMQFSLNGTTYTIQNPATAGIDIVPSKFIEICPEVLFTMLLEKPK